MPRIKGRKPEDTREAALEAAIWAFAELGYANATLSIIAQKAGVTAATLPYHFRDKQGLWDAVIEEFYKKLLAFGASLTGVGAPPGVASPPSLELALMRVYDWCEENRNGIRVIIRNVIETGALDRQVREVRMGAALALVSRFVAQRFGVDEARARDTAVAVTHLVTRFVTNSPEDNAAAFGATSQAEVRARILDILVRVARALLAPPQ
ncbi:MAG: TetR/AcrR family transcriptional regulator [Deltaproteobacteria bacterium]|nr:TetR/AcrR family transcriptional regulator [Deltaproteobacteria bacterium]